MLISAPIVERRWMGVRSMVDYISREDAIEVINQGRLTKLIEADVVESGLKNLPAADVVLVVHAYWIPQKENYEFKEAWMKCSACGYPVSKWTGNTNFCPNCGARMDGGKED